MQLERAPRGMSAVALALSLAGACDRGHREAPAAPLPTPGAPKTAPMPGCSLAPIPVAMQISAKRLVAIGDLHGDLGGTRAALRAAHAIDDQDRWIGGDLVV